MKDKEQVLSENQFYKTSIVNGERVTYYKTGFHKSTLFLDGDEKGSEDVVPYKTNYQPEDK